jgi:hypothetical protein
MHLGKSSGADLLLSDQVSEPLITNYEFCCLYLDSRVDFE